MEQEICACNGLANIEEWERSGYRMDYDRDGIPNFYDLDDDDDKLPTSVELGAGLNPFNPRDAHGDKDSDGLDNHWEYENGTMITDVRIRYYKHNKRKRLIYKEILLKNKRLKDIKISYVFASIFWFFSILVICIIYIINIFTNVVLYGFACILSIIGMILSIILYIKSKKIKALEVYEEGFTWPYYNWPTKDGFVYWEDVEKIILNVKEAPSYMFIVLNLNNKKDIYPLKKYAIYDIERFLDIAKEKGVEVVEDEISYRELQRLRNNL